jgi:hypothetical protein
MMPAAAAAWARGVTVRPGAQAVDPGRSRLARGLTQAQLPALPLGENRLGFGFKFKLAPETHESGQAIMIIVSSIRA